MVYCEYCGGDVCGKSKRMSVAQWNKCPRHRADREVGTSITYWLLGVISFGIIPDIVLSNKIKKYTKKYKSEKSLENR